MNTNDGQQETAQRSETLTSRDGQGAESFKQPKTNRLHTILTSVAQSLVCIFLVLSLSLLLGCSKSPEAALLDKLATLKTGVIELPPGTLELSKPLVVLSGSDGVEIRGSKTRLVASPTFQGKALIVIENARNVTLRDFEIDGNREKLAKPAEMAPPENAFRIWYPNNGILADLVQGLKIEHLTISNIVNFPVLVSRSAAVRISDVNIRDSGNKNAKGRNNLSGGILIEEGTVDFEVARSTFENITGNGLWTHSLLTSPQLQDGAFLNNKFGTIGRDALQVGHAKRVKVDGNTGHHIGYPVDVVDSENGGVPVVLDTAGDVEGTQYSGNQFFEINGKCIDLDGFHDGVVVDNICTNRRPVAEYPHGHYGIVMNNSNPKTHSSNIELNGNTIDGAKFGGLFLMGSGNHVAGNKFLNLNLAGCNGTADQSGCVYKPDEPKMLGSGIYLGRGIAREEETKGNVIRGNTITGHNMSKLCVVQGPGVNPASNTVEDNHCSDSKPKATNTK
ncbi:MAG: right-handed parallel beta-helix repeat-containing protein [Acidobacteriota bacterium]